MISRLNKIIFWGILAIIIVAGLAYYQWKQTETTGPAEEGQQPTEQVKIPTATASIDAAVDAAIQGLEAESSAVADEDKDSSLLDADKQAANDFGQSYDEKEF